MNRPRVTFENTDDNNSSNNSNNNGGTIRTHNWLRILGLKSEMEGFIKAAQDQTVPTSIYHHHIKMDGTDPMWIFPRKSRSLNLLLYSTG